MSKGPTMKLISVLVAAALSAFVTVASADDLDKAIPAPAVDPAESALQTVVLAGGCFWGQQGLFEHVKGVSKVVAGYSGGAGFNAQYPVVSTGTTGHAESG